jgi:hypothetical protein
MKQQNGITDPPLDRLGNFERGYKRNAEEDRDESDGREECVICIHGSEGLEWSEGVQREDQDDFANGKEDQLCDSRRLYCANSNAPYDVEKHRDKGKRRCLVGIGVV